MNENTRRYVECTSDRIVGEALNKCINILDMDMESFDEFCLQFVNYLEDMEAIQSETIKKFGAILNSELNVREATEICLSEIKYVNYGSLKGLFWSKHLKIFDTGISYTGFTMVKVELTQTDGDEYLKWFEQGLMDLNDMELRGLAEFLLKNNKVCGL